MAAWFQGREGPDGQHTRPQAVGATITFDGDEPASVHAKIVAWILSRQNDADMRTPGKSDGGFVVTGRIDGVTVQASTDPDNDKVWSVLAWGDTHPVTMPLVRDPW